MFSASRLRALTRSLGPASEVIFSLEDGRRLRFERAMIEPRAGGSAELRFQFTLEDAPVKVAGRPEPPPPGTTN